MKVKVTEYAERKKEAPCYGMPINEIKTWYDTIPACISMFRAIDYITAKYPGRLLGITII